MVYVHIDLGFFRPRLTHGNTICYLFLARILRDRRCRCRNHLSRVYIIFFSMDAKPNFFKKISILTFSLLIHPHIHLSILNKNKTLKKKKLFLRVMPGLFHVSLSQTWPQPRLFHVGPSQAWPQPLQGHVSPGPGRASLGFFAHPTLLIYFFVSNF